MSGKYPGENIPRVAIVDKPSRGQDPRTQETDDEVKQAEQAVRAGVRGVGVGGVRGHQLGDQHPEPEWQRQVDLHADPSLGRLEGDRRGHRRWQRRLPRHRPRQHPCGSGGADRQGRGVLRHSEVQRRPPGHPVHQRARQQHPRLRGAGHRGADRGLLVRRRRGHLRPAGRHPQHAERAGPLRPVLPHDDRRRAPGDAPVPHLDGRGAGEAAGAPAPLPLRGPHGGAVLVQGERRDHRAAARSRRPGVAVGGAEHPLAAGERSRAERVGLERAAFKVTCEVMAAESVPRGPAPSLSSENENNGKDSLSAVTSTTLRGPLAVPSQGKWSGS